jgi:starch synthase
VELLFITSEITPYSRSGEIGDVCAALPKALRGGGHKVTVISPLWPGIDATGRGLARRLSGVEVDVAGERFACTLHDGRTTGGVDLIFVGHAEVFAAGITGGDARAQLRAALVFVQAAAQVAKSREPALDVVHAHGAFAAGSLALLAELLPTAARVLSLHDPHAGLPVGDAALPEPIAALAGLGDQRSLLVAGFVAAQRAVTGSAATLTELASSGPFAHLLAQDGSKLVSIPDALDAARWNPLTDPLIPARFDPVDLRGKARCKDGLQLELGLPIAPDVPLVVCVGSLAQDGGGELLVQALPALLRNELQLVVAGSDPQLELQVREIGARAEERLRAVFPLDEKAAHRAIAAADLLLIPGRNPSYPDLHLSGQRYGALPVARRIGALADAVVDCDAQLLTGTGFLFDEDEPAALAATLQRALAAFSQRRGFDGLRLRCMKLDLSWERSARRYEHLYKTIKG